MQKPAADLLLMLVMMIGLGYSAFSAPAFINSGHLFNMLQLYQMLYRDAKYDKPKSIVFRWEPAMTGLDKAQTFLIQAEK